MSTLDDPNMTVEEAVVHIDELLGDYEISMHMGPTASQAWRLTKAAALREYARANSMPTDK